MNKQEGLKNKFSLIQCVGYILITLNSLIISGCKTPAQKFNETAESYTFQTAITTGTIFQHRVFMNQKAITHLPGSATVLHVYLDGDGSPWIKQRWKAKDPTSLNPLILNLMQLDDSPAILLGRPCYHGMNDSPSCDPKFWTSHRYSRQVVLSMVQALRHWLDNQQWQRIVLIGHSGGGTLAVLMAAHLNGLEVFVTVAANLDVAAWSEYHGYLPLSDSLNPATETDKLSIKQIHLAGGNDHVVPLSIIKTFSQQQEQATLMVYEEYGHICCWQEVWPQILNLLP